MKASHNFLGTKLWFKSKRSRKSEVKLPSLWSKRKIVKKWTGNKSPDFPTINTDTFRISVRSLPAYEHVLLRRKHLRCVDATARSRWHSPRWWRRWALPLNLTPCRAAPRLGGSISAGSLTSTQQLVPSSGQSPYFDLLWILRLSEGAWSLFSFGTAPRCVGVEQGK